MHTCIKCGYVEHQKCKGETDAESFFKRIGELTLENEQLKKDLAHSRRVSDEFEKNSLACAEEFEAKLKAQAQVTKLEAKLSELEAILPFSKRTNAAPTS